MNNKCIHCGSEKIIADLPLFVSISIDTQESLSLPKNINSNVQVSVTGSSKSFFNRDVVSSNLLVKVCGNCGFSELYAKEYDLLYKKYSNHSILDDLI